MAIQEEASRQRRNIPGTQAQNLQRAAVAAEGGTTVFSSGTDGETKIMESGDGDGCIRGAFKSDFWKNLGFCPNQENAKNYIKNHQSPKQWDFFMKK